MAYLNLVDLKAAAPQLRISADSRPNEAQVQAIIDQVSAELDVRMKNIGFETPISVATSPLSYRILQNIATREVLSQTLEMQYAGVSNPDGYGATRFHEQFMEKLNQLLDPNDPFTLPDAINVNVQEKLVGETGGISAMIGIDDDDYRLTRNMGF